MFRHFHKRGQSTLEYAVVVAIIVGALIVMQNYIKRGMQGRLKSAADEMGEQFSPDSSAYNYTTTSNSETRDETLNGVSTTYIDTGEQSRTGSENIGKLSEEKW